MRRALLKALCLLALDAAFFGVCGLFLYGVGRVLMLIFSL